MGRVGGWVNPRAVGCCPRILGHAPSEPWLQALTTTGPGLTEATAAKTAKQHASANRKTYNANTTGLTAQHRLSTGTNCSDGTHDNVQRSATSHPGVLGDAKHS